MEIKDITSNFNLSVMAVLSEPLKLSDVLFKMKEMGIEADETLPTQMLTNPRMIMFNVSGPGIKLTRILDSDLMTYNLQYPSQLRGILTFKVQNIPIETSPEPHFQILADLINKLEYENKLLFFEVVINFEADFISFVSVRNLFPNLSTITDPKLYSLRLFDGKIADKDPREELWSEIQIEPIINNPKKVVVNAIYRKREYGEDLINDIFGDIQKIFRKLGGKND